MAKSFYLDRMVNTQTVSSESTSRAFCKTYSSLNLSSNTFTIQRNGPSGYKKALCWPLYPTKDASILATNLSLTKSRNSGLVSRLESFQLGSLALVRERATNALSAALFGRLSKTKRYSMNDSILIRVSQQMQAEDLTGTSLSTTESRSHHGLERVVFG